MLGGRNGSVNPPMHPAVHIWTHRLHEWEPSEIPKLDVFVHPFGAFVDSRSRLWVALHPGIF